MREAAKRLKELIERAQADETIGQRAGQNAPAFASYKQRGQQRESVLATFPSKENRKF
jgi:hypothetical protein